VNFFDAGDRLNHIFGQVLYRAALDPTGKNNFAAAYFDFDIAGIDARVVGQALAYIFENSFIGATIAFWTAPDVGPAAAVVIAIEFALARLVGPHLVTPVITLIVSTRQRRASMFGCNRSLSVVRNMITAPFEFIVSVEMIMAAPMAFTRTPVVVVQR
jgi:hypothetical protein